jgi:hypothetical protein
MQYDPGNMLGIASKFEQNKLRMGHCGEQIPNADELRATFPPIREVAEVEYDFHKEMVRVVAFQQQQEQQRENRRSRYKYVSLIGALMGAVGILYFVWRRFGKAKQES